MSPAYPIVKGHMMDHLAKYYNNSLDNLGDARVRTRHDRVEIEYGCGAEDACDLFPHLDIWIGCRDRQIWHQRRRLMG